MKTEIKNNQVLISDDTNEIKLNLEGSAGLFTKNEWIEDIKEQTTSSGFRLKDKTIQEILTHLENSVNNNFFAPEDRAEVLTKIKEDVNTFAEDITNRLNDLCNSLGYIKGSQLSRRIDRIELFTKELNEFEL